MATISIVLKTKQKLLNGEYSVSLRITHQKKSYFIAVSSLVTNQSIKWRCKITDWKPAESEDNGLGRFRKSYHGYKEANMILEEKLNQAKLILSQYDKENKEFHFESFEAKLKKKNNNKISSIQDYYAVQIERLEKQGRIGLAGLYLESKRILEKFSSEALLTDVNFKFLESFEYWLRNNRGNKDTTISVKMRNLQRVINQAIEDELLKKDVYPFGEKKYSINKRLNHTTKKLAISIEDIKRIKSLKLPEHSAIHLARQMFLFSYFSRGMNFIDMVFLKWSSVSATHIIYRRKKTGGNFEIPINRYNKTILEFYNKNYYVAYGYVFPIINDSIHITVKQKYTRKKTALKAVNDNLKKIAKMVDIKNLKLSTNVGRHTYATGLKYAGVNTSYISQALGHSTEAQTQTYLADFDSDLLREADDILFDKEG